MRLKNMPPHVHCSHCNAAVKKLDAYMKQLRGIAKVALRQRPDLLKKLNA